jgi:hypothetical protein
MQFVQYSEAWSHYRKNAELIRMEGEDYLALSGRYAKFDTHDQAFTKFIQVITTYKRREVESFMESSRSDSEKGKDESKPAEKRS